jgi:lysophospholipase L1-like esterase
MKNIYYIFVFLFAMGCSRPAPKHWVAIGDSITYLNDHLDETDNRITKGYLSRVEDYLPNFSVTNKGYNGWTVIKIAERFDRLEVPKADVYTIFLGTNDWWAGNSLGSMEDYQNASGNATVMGAYRHIIDKVRSLNPDAAIILITPMQRVDFVYVNNYKNNAYGSYKSKKGQHLEAFAEGIKSIGMAEGFKTIDLYHHPALQHENLVHFKRLKNPETGTYKDHLYPDFIGLSFDPEMDIYPYPKEAIDMTYDGLHPSDQGNEVIAKALIKVFSQL